ncbi:hypothetical protein LR48_Vigan03g133700 [Vigna angularis]|uniref:Uncharacterized protein n=2 Tax=Phaseolus angularis TaxID=3914 RepID=A0A0L9U5B7_PHAAN|nr:hypothetical protein LR48_Vigan03g133700 [Vigna angularis]
MKPQLLPPPSCSPSRPNLQNHPQVADTPNSQKTNRRSLTCREAQMKNPKHKIKTKKHYNLKGFLLQDSFPTSTRHRRLLPPSRRRSHSSMVGTEPPSTITSRFEGRKLSQLLPPRYAHAQITASATAIAPH